MADLQRVKSEYITSSERMGWAKRGVALAGLRRACWSYVPGKCGRVKEVNIQERNIWEKMFRMIISSKLNQ